MGELSRRSSRLVLASDDERSLTSFPSPEAAAAAAATTGSPLLQTISDEPLDKLLKGTGPTIFDEQADNRPTDPQSISAAPRHVIENVIDHQGAVNLVKKLSTLLAERDAHITALKRLAEEYNVPQDRIDAATSRAKQAEERRLGLRLAASENFLDASSSDGSSSKGTKITPSLLDATTSGGTVKGLTRLFGGATLRPQRDSGKTTPSSSRASSQVPAIRERPRSIDARSITSTNTVQSAASNDSGAPGWAASLFGNATQNRPRNDSRANREPVELVTQHDPDQLPPTLSKRTGDPQTAAWNKFMTRLDQLRSHNGSADQANGIGTIGASHWGQEGAMGQKKLKTLTQLLLGGVPMSLRHTIWMELSNTDAILEPGLYRSYLLRRDKVDPAEIDAIVKDVPRTLTSKYEYYAKKGDKRLKDVLVAFVSKYEGLGYTQGLNTIAGYLLLAVPEDEHAFWMLCNMVDHFFPGGYFSREKAMTGPLSDSIVLRSYIESELPDLAKHLDKLDIAADHTVPLKWFLTAFSDVLPEEVLMRVWDIWLCVPGQKAFLFNVALTILSQNKQGLMGCENEGEYWSFIDNSCKVDGDAPWRNELIREAFSWRKKLEDVETKRTFESRVMRKRKGSTEALYSPA
ncbi:TBC-domain-containing protein [Teratosphaeria nubilosa]|uniref:TBC-domain-containing protein n=1 Tax=Teratosphaeria nubilosa TaxID=161662 RepID=A0A6G1KWA5_9PEZI|nr:TBC-domain-containing protein [Teratosphaeria nubilosa]